MLDPLLKQQATRLYMQDGRSVFIVAAFSVSLLILAWSGLDYYFAPAVFFHILTVRLTVTAMALAGALIVKRSESLVVYDRLMVAMSTYVQLCIGYMIVIVPDAVVEKYLLGYVLCILGLGSILLWPIRSFVMFAVTVLLGQTFMGLLAGTPVNQLVYVVIVTMSALVIASVFVVVRSRVTINNYLQKLLVDERNERLNKIFASVENAIGVIGMKDEQPVLQDGRSASFDRGFPEWKGRVVSFEEFIGAFQLSHDQKAVHTTVIQSAIGDVTLGFEVNSGNLASRLLRPLPDGQTAYYDVSYSPLINKTGVVSGILISLLDVTERLRSEEKARETEFMSQCMMDVIKVGYGKYIRGVQQISELMTKGELALHRLLDAHDNVRRRHADEYFAVLHTIKGNARSLGFNHIANQAHAVESILNEIRKGSLTSRTKDAMLNQEMAQLSHHVRVYQKIMQDIGGSESNIILPRKGFKKAMEFESWRDIRSMIEKGGDDAEELRDFLSNAFMSLDYALHELDPTLEKTARALSKPIPKLKIMGHNPWLTADAAHAVKNALIHITTNAMDHGIETPEERRIAGKQDIGEIVITAGMTAGGARLCIHDDGRGLDMGRLRELLSAQGADPLQSDIDVAMSIFKSGLSTKKDVTEISGRGVGMVAVKDILESEGANVGLTLGEKHSDGHCAFEITIDLPTTALWT